MLKEPTKRQLETIVDTICEEMLRVSDTSHIANGIRRVRVNEIGIISEVYVSQGLFARLVLSKVWGPDASGVCRSYQVGWAGDSKSCL